MNELALRVISTILSLLTFVYAKAQNTAQQNDNYLPIETVVADLNNDGKTDTISVYMPPVEGDPGIFGKINISLGSKGRNTFTADDIWDKIDNVFAKENTNAVHSNLVFVRKEQAQAFILLFGFAYGSGRDEISLIRIKDNTIEMLIDNKLENPLKFIDPDNDGITELVCQKPPELYGSDAKGDIGSYSPFLIYKCDNVMSLDKKMTETYNKQNYVWAGYKYNGNIKLRYPKTGKPEIIK